MTIEALILPQFDRVLAQAEEGAVLPACADAGFLDLLRAEEDGGAGLTLNEFLPIVLEIGRRGIAEPIAETMIARSVDAACPALPTAEQVDAILAPSRRLAATVTAGLMSGAIENIFELTLEFVRTREQFGRRIGEFQAIQQQMAVFAEEVIAARTAVNQAFRGSADALDDRCAAIAKIRTGEAASVTVAIAHAVHGAIGISEEYPLGLFARNLRRWRDRFGREEWWAEQLGNLLLQGGTDMVSILVEIAAEREDAHEQA